MTHQQPAATPHDGRDPGSAPETSAAWVGDLEISDPGNLDRIYALSGIDASAWRICGLDVRLSFGQGLRAGLLAVERDRLNQAEGDWRTVAETHERRIPVTEFRLEPSAAHRLLALFPDVSLVAANRRAVPSEGVELTVVESVMPPAAATGLESDPTRQPG